MTIAVDLGRIATKQTKQSILYVVGTQKNRLNQRVLLSTQNICLNCWIRKYLQFYAQNFSLTGPMICYGSPFAYGKINTDATHLQNYMFFFFFCI